MVLEDRDIIQVDSTVIAGALILLTLSNIAGETSHIKNLIGLVAYMVIFPFAVSAILVCLKQKRAEPRDTEPRDKIRDVLMSYSLGLMMVGFIGLIIILIVYFIVPYAPLWKPGF